MIVTSPDPTWPDQFAVAARHLRAALGEEVLRIDHIGSTSVPGLKAKDIIDLQLTVTDLGDGAPWCRRLREAGYTVKPELQVDHMPPWGPLDAVQWSKRYAREPDGRRRTHIHVRVAGTENQRFALLFRDFLRVDDRFAQGYARVKERLAELFPHSIETYLYVKDPVVDLIVAAAENWAASTGWKPGPSDA